MVSAPANPAELFQNNTESDNGCERYYPNSEDSWSNVEETGGKFTDPVPGSAQPIIAGTRRRRRRGAQFTPNEFWRHVVKGHPYRCWIWQGTVLEHNGYGSFWYPPQQQTTVCHRIAWMLTHGDIPHGLKVLHRCDNPICVNPKHLFLGTQLDNMRDMAAKGRRSPDAHTRKGAKFTPEHRAKLSEARKRWHAEQRAAKVRKSA